jgi:hypothetical protein
MRIFIELLRARVIPALIVALGVSFITAGLLTYVTGTDALGPTETRVVVASDAPSVGPTLGALPGLSTASPNSATRSPVPTGYAPITGTASPVPAGSGSPVPVPSSSFGPSGGPSSGPSREAGAAASPSPTSRPPSGGRGVPAQTPTPGKRVVTRVVIAALNIDLPVVKPPGGPTTFPLCNVAMYLPSLDQPGELGATYIYAHARVGMFLPILDASMVNNGHAMIGMLVQVYTSDDREFLYTVTEVRRHQRTLNDAIVATVPELWLQTSEGPSGAYPKVQLVAKPLSSGPASYVDAHPVPRPVVCF